MSFKKITEVFSPEDAGTASSIRMTVVGGPAVNVWSTPGTLTEGDTQTELKVQLQPNKPIVIGRKNGGQIEYLDPKYQPTPMMPGSARTILTSKEEDIAVSRGHFMLKGSPLGIYLVNGVPRRGGGIRPPVNGTILLEPVKRSMDKGEEYLIERGTSAKIRLPNGTVILLVPDNE
jgi:hypothetical protein